MTSVIIVDTETTSKYPEAAHAVEVGALWIDLETGAELGTFESVANPGPDLLRGAERALEISGLTREQILSAPANYIVAEKFREFVSGAALTGFNVGYDSQVLAKAPWGVQACMWNRDMDVMFMAFHAMLTETPIKLEWMAWKNDYKWPRLDEAARHYGLLSGAEQTHRALDDCRLTAKLLMKLRSLAADSPREPQGVPA